MTLYFINKDKERRELVTNVRCWEDAVDLIRDYLDLWNVKWDYIRVMHPDNNPQFDFGSHVAFFELR